MLLTSPLAWSAEHAGQVLETMDAAGYTYAKISENQQQYWIAGPATGLKVGDEVQFSEQMWMRGFTSKTLNRNFDKLLFVSGIVPANGTAKAALPPGHPPTQAATTGAPQPSAISKAEGGYTVAELFSKKAELKGQPVKVHGQVVKVSNGIMGSNWIHIQDGSGSTGSNDIIFRAKTDTATVGDIVIAQGTLVTDQDFGFNYQYSVIVEDASILTRQ